MQVVLASSLVSAGTVNERGEGEEDEEDDNEIEDEVIKEKEEEEEEEDGRWSKDKRGNYRHTLTIQAGCSGSDVRARVVA